MIPSTVSGVVDTAGEAAGYSYDAVGNLLAITRGTSAQTSVISFSPSQGPVGTAVTIYGTGFSTTTSSDSVTFNGSAATICGTTALDVHHGPLGSKHRHDQRDQPQRNWNQCNKLCCPVECGNANHQQLFADDWNPRNVD